MQSMSRWSKESLKAYKESGDAVKALGGHAMHELSGHNYVLTFWATPKGLVVTQVFTDTADVVYLKDLTLSDLELAHFGVTA